MRRRRRGMTPRRLPGCSSRSARPGLSDSSSVLPGCSATAPGQPGGLEPDLSTKIAADGWQRRAWHGHAGCRPPALRCTAPCWRAMLQSGAQAGSFASRCDCWLCLQAAAPFLLLFKSRGCCEKQRLLQWAKTRVKPERGRAKNRAKCRRQEGRQVRVENKMWAGGVQGKGVRRERVMAHKDSPHQK